MCSILSFLFSSGILLQEQPTGGAQGMHPAGAALPFHAACSAAASALERRRFAFSQLSHAQFAHRLRAASAAAKDLRALPSVLRLLCVLFELQQRLHRGLYR